MRPLRLIPWGKVAGNLCFSSRLRTIGREPRSEGGAVVVHPDRNAQEDSQRTSKDATGRLVGDRVDVNRRPSVSTPKRWSSTIVTLDQFFHSINQELPCQCVRSL